MPEVLQEQDRPICKGACSCKGQAAFAEEDKTPCYDREKVEDGEYGLAAATVIDEYGDEKYVCEELSIGKGGIPFDKSQDQPSANTIEVEANNESGNIRKGRDDNMLFS